VGPSGRGRATVASAIAERVVERGYRLCLVDPEGALRGVRGLAAIGTAERAPDVEEVVALIGESRASVAVSLLAMPREDRPGFVARLRPRLAELRARTGRPHWLAIDEAHLLLPRELDDAAAATVRDPGGLLLATAHPAGVCEAVLRSVNVAIAVGDDAPSAIGGLAAAAGVAPPSRVPRARDGEAVLWRPGDAAAPLRLTR
jgi:hypothetical protein